jgi:hypothetical protein
LVSAEAEQPLVLVGSPRLPKVLGDSQGLPPQVLQQFSLALGAAEPWPQVSGPLALVAPQGVADHP